jgi:hypothetical protein
MTTRLEITHGLVAERERLATSADSLSVTWPTTGSKTRSKGVLFVLATSTLPGPRAREATMLVADTIRREYYYDESAGVPVCLEKAVKSADRRLRNSRERTGTLPGSIGVAVAVVRNNELYLATIGTVEAYLVRSARLLMPDRTVSPGLPADDSATLDVWRGELSLGDALLLVSRNMTETVGTEELKSAMLTLHPQAAVEHLHHLFVAAGGEGSDGLIAVEATEQSSRPAGRIVPAAAGEVYGDIPGMLPEPVAGAMGASLFRARIAVEASVSSLVDRAWDAMPKRDTAASRISSKMSRAETQRRVAIGAMALIGVVFLLGALVIVLPREGDASVVETIAGGDSALSEGRELTLRAENLLSTDPARALGFYRKAWSEIVSARAIGLEAPALDALEERVRTGLDQIYLARRPQTRTVVTFRDDEDPIALARGPSGAAYYLDAGSSSITRVGINNGSTVEVAVKGDGPAGGGKARLRTPTQIESSPTEVVIVDDDRQVWRWRPSDTNGNGTLARLIFQGGSQWGEDHGDMATFESELGFGYRLYVVEPSQSQILRYRPTFDRSSFQLPEGYLVTGRDVTRFRQLHIDSDIFVLAEDDSVLRFEIGRYPGQFAIHEPPDAGDLRPGHDYRLVTGTGTAGSGGTLYLYDALWGRIIAFSKVDGSYQGQWVPGTGDRSMEDIRGMYVVAGKKKDPDRLLWTTPEGVFESALVTARPGTEASPEPASGGKKKKKKGN